MTAHDDDQGASLQPIDSQSHARGCTVWACIGAAVWLVIIALGLGWWR